MYVPNKQYVVMAPIAGASKRALHFRTSEQHGHGLPSRIAWAAWMQLALALASTA